MADAGDDERQALVANLNKNNISASSPRGRFSRSSSSSPRPSPPVSFPHDAAVHPFSPGPVELSDDTAGDSDGGPANANVVPTIVRDALPTLGRSDSPSNSNSDSLSTGSRPNSARRGSGFSNADILDIARVASRSPGMPRSAFSETGGGRIGAGRAKMKRSSSASDTDSDMTLTEMDSQRQLEALQKLSLDLRRESIGNLAEIQEESENFARRNSRILNEEMAAAVAANPEAAGDAEDIPFRFAAYCIQDALEGRDNHGRLNLHRVSGVRYKAFLMQSSPIMEWTFFLAVTVHSIVIFWEDSQRIAAGVLMAASLLVFILDTVLKATYMLPGDFFSKRWNKIQVCLVLLFLIDYGLFLGDTLQPFRLFRPWILLCRNRELRRVYQAIISMVLTVLEVLGAILVFLVFFAGIAIHTFPGDYNESDTFVSGRDEVDFTGSFDHVGIGFIRLFVLVTTENYPDVMLPAYRENKRSFVFFGVFLVFGVFYILPMLLAVVMDSYWSATGDMVKKDRRKERRKLIEAFNFLDPEGTGIIKMEAWVKLLKVLKPKLPEGAAEFLFGMMDKQENGCINIFEWLEVGQVLKARIVSEPEEIDPDDLSPFHASMHRACSSVIEWEHWDVTILWLLVLHWGLFLTHWHDMPKSAENAIQGLSTVLLVIFIADIIMRIVVRGIHFEYNTAVFGIQISFLEVTAILAAIVDTSLYWAGVCDVGFCSTIGDIAMFMRILYKSNRTLEAVRIFSIILPLSIKLMLIMAFVQYSYAVVGLEVFHGVRFAEPSYCNTDADYATAVATGIDPHKNFGTMWCSWLVIFQVISTSNWHLLMNETMESKTRWSSLFFISCFALTNFLILSLMVGVFIDAFFKTSKPKKGKKKDVDTSIAVLMQETAENEAAEDSGKASPFESNNRSMENTIVSAKIPVVVEPTASPQGSPRVGRKRYRMVGDSVDERMNINARGRRPRTPTTMRGRRCVAVEEYETSNKDHLPLAKGDVVLIQEMDEVGDMIKGWCNNKTGWFPSKNVLMVQEAVAARRGPMQRVASFRDRDRDRDRGGGLRPRPSVPEISFAAASPEGDEPEMDEGTGGASAQAQGALPTESQADEGGSSKRFVVKNLGLSRRDWVANDITNMNPDELRELNALAKANMERWRGHGAKRPGRQSSVDAKPPPALAAVAESALMASSPGETRRPSANRKEVPCELCDKVFHSKAQLKGHMRTHGKRAAARSSSTSKDRLSVGSTPPTSPTAAEAGPASPRASGSSTGNPQVKVDEDSDGSDGSSGRASAGGGGGKEMPEWARKLSQSHAVSVTVSDHVGANVPVATGNSPNSTIDNSVLDKIVRQVAGEEDA